MGIKNYCTNILELFPEITTKKVPNNIDVLLLDVNTILHNI